MTYSQYLRYIKAARAYAGIEVHPPRKLRVKSFPFRFTWLAWDADRNEPTYEHSDNLIEENNVTIHGFPDAIDAFEKKCGHSILSDCGLEILSAPD